MPVSYNPEGFLMNLSPEELDQKIREARGRNKTDASDRKPALAGGGSRALRAASDLGAAVFVGGVLGYWLDRWLGTLPLFLILLFFAGFVAGFLNLYRSQTGKDKKEEERK
jgi:ATP synthase protein I